MTTELAALTATPSATATLHQLTDKLMKSILNFKTTHEERFVMDMKVLSDQIRALGYFPYYLPKMEILIVSREPMSESGRFNA